MDLSLRTSSFSKNLRSSSNQIIEQLDFETHSAIATVPVDETVPGSGALEVMPEY